MDDNIAKLGIPLVSKCNCCVSPKQETIDHVLCSGEFATKVWNYFASILGVHLPQTRSWQGILNVWWLLASTSTHAGVCRGIMPIIITWALWRARCKAWMEEKNVDWRGVT